MKYRIVAVLMLIFLCLAFGCDTVDTGGDAEIPKNSKPEVIIDDGTIPVNELYLIELFYPEAVGYGGAFEVSMKATNITGKIIKRPVAFDRGHTVVDIEILCDDVLLFNWGMMFEPTPEAMTIESDGFIIFTWRYNGAYVLKNKPLLEQLWNDWELAPKGKYSIKVSNGQEFTDAIEII